MPSHQPTRITPLLLIGIALGLATAMMGLMQSRAPAPAGALPDDVAARVGDAVITRAAYDAALQAIASERRAPLDAKDRRRVLEQMVNEALLVAHGRALDLPARVPRLRGLLVDEVLEILRSEAASRPVTDAERRAYYAAHTARFRGPDLLHIRALHAPDRASAEAARARLGAGTGAAALPNEEAQGEPANSRASSQALPEGVRRDTALPDGPLPPDKLRDYLGPAATDVAERLAPGEVSEPLPGTDGFLLLQMVARYPADAPAFDTIRPALTNAILRERAEALLHERLEMLRRQMAPQIAEDLPQ